MKTRNCWFWFCFILLPFTAGAQQKEYILQHFTQEDGLPSNESYFVYRDSRNFLWFATDNGVVRFNGSRMERFPLPDNVVFKIREDKKGRIWFFTRTGRLSYFQQEKIHPYAFNDSIQKYCLPLLINDAWINDAGEIYLNSLRYKNFVVRANGAVSVFPYAPWVHNEHGYKPSPGHFEIKQIGNQQYFSSLNFLASPGSDSLLISVPKGTGTRTYAINKFREPLFGLGSVKDDANNFYIYYGKTLLKLRPDGSCQRKQFGNVINAICRGPGQSIWVGFMKAGAEQIDSSLQIITPETLMAAKSVTSICYDHEGGCWFSTLESGIYYLKTQQVSRLRADSVLGGPVFRLCHDLDSNILLGSNKGIFLLKNEAFHPLLRKNFLQVFDLRVNPVNEIMISTTADSFSDFGYRVPLSDKIHKYANIFYAPSEIVELPDTSYLLSNYEVMLRFSLHSLKNGSKFIPVDTSDELKEPGPFYLDQQHRIWQGTIRNLYYFDSAKGAAHIFMPGSIFRNGISCIRQLPNGILCFGVRFNGIVLMKDSVLLANITEKEGLLSNAVKYLLPLGNDLWAATSNGISVIRFQSFSPLRYTIVNLGKNLGLNNTIISQLLPGAGRMLVASSNGLFQIDDPESLLAAATQPIPFYINAVSYYKGDTANLTTIRLPAGKNRIIIRLSAVSYNLPGELRYYYRFTGTDTSWNSTASPDLLFENMSPGKYRIELRAGLPGLNRFSEIKTFTLIIEKYWWQHNGLRLLALLLLIASLLLFLRHRIRTVTKRAQQSTALHKKMTELEQTALRSQMNPHFIFNCLTSIQHLVLTGNKEEASEYLVKFARLIRKTLEFSAHSFTSVEEEIKYLEEYIVLEQLRMPGSFTFTITTASGFDTAGTEIPNMMIQPLIENSIRHGIKNLQHRKGEIHLELKQENNYIVCVVTDNGVGRSGALQNREHNPYSRHKSYGIDIIQKRLEVLTGPAYEPGLFTITDLVNEAGEITGTCNTLYLPFKKNRI